MEPDFNYKSGGPESPFSPGPLPPTPAPQKPERQKPNTFATLSLITGIFGLVSCCFPPLQLLFGAAAIMLAVISKKGGPFSGISIAGLVLGILSVVCSLVLFACFAYTVKLMQDPEYARMINQMMEEYQHIFESYQAQ